MANRYFLNIGANYNATANWSDTSGGTGGFSVPTNADDVFFDANSGNCTVNVASVAKSVNFTGYTNTITMTSTLTVSGSVTLVAAMTIAGASGLTINATGTFTSNGKTWPNALTFSGTITITLADDLSVGGLLTISGATTVNGNFNINANGGLSALNTFTQGTGVTTLNILGGTWSGNNSVSLNTNINGNITISGTINYQTRTLTYVSGTITTTVSTINITSATLNTSGMTWNNVGFANNTLTSDLNVGGLFSIAGNPRTVNGNFNINCYGGISMGDQFTQGTGTTTLNLLGGTWTAISTASFIGINTTINGNITISGTVAYRTGILTYTSGTVTHINNSTLNIGASTTLNTSGMSWNNVTFSATNTTTLTSNLNINGLLTISGATTVNGSFNINCNGGLSASAVFTQGTGLTTLNINGGTFTQTNSTGIIINTTNINGNVTIGTTLWMNSPNFNYLSGAVITSGSNLINQTATTLNWNLNGIIWDTITFNSPITLLSDLYCVNFIKQGTSNRILTGFSIYVSGNLNFSSGGTMSGTTNIILNGTGTITNSALQNNLTINTSGTINIIGNLLYSTGTLNLQNGKIIANTATLSTGLGATFINCDKINFKTITVGGGQTITMNRFFSGSALTPTRIQSSTTANYIIVFQDGFEKITKFTKISNCTVTNRGQLLCITDKSNKGGNVGIRYINQSPNGIAKNAPTSPNPMAYGLPSFLDSDPNFIVG